MLKDLKHTRNPQDAEPLGRVFVHLVGAPFMMCDGKRYTLAEVERIETANDIVLEVIVQ